MGKFTPTVIYDTTFEGEAVRVTLRRLQRKDFYALAPHMKIDSEGHATMEFQDNVVMARALDDVLPEYVVSINGVTDPGGQPIAKETILGEMYFLPLVGEIISELFRISKLGEDELKNSDGRPGDTSKGLPSPAA